MANDDMKVKDETVHNGLPRVPSVGTMSDADLVAAKNVAGQIDPLAGHFVEEQQLASLPADRRAAVMSGAADPHYAKHGLTIGARVYHKTRKEEGKVKDMAASGKVQVSFDSGDTVWLKHAENLVSL